MQLFNVVAFNVQAQANLAISWLEFGYFVFQTLSKLSALGVIRDRRNKETQATRLRWSRGSVLAFGTQARGFALGRIRRIFRVKKSSGTPSFGGKAKPSVPCRSFTACKRSLNVTWKSAFRQNSRTFLAHSSTFRRWVLSRGDMRRDVWWRKLERLTQIAQ
jgi:hypothetical protein